MTENAANPPSPEYERAKALIDALNREYGGGYILHDVLQALIYAKANDAAWLREARSRAMCG